MQENLKAEDKPNIWKESIELATNAVSKDIKDPMSWYILGNAHLTCYFLETDRYEHLNYALKAYTQSEKNEDPNYPNPDLYYNRGTIWDYLEQYNQAILDYIKSDLIDPNLHAKEKGTKIIDFVIATSKLIEKWKASKNDKDIKLVKTVPSKIGEVKFPTSI